MTNADKPLFDVSIQRDTGVPRGLQPRPRGMVSGSDVSLLCSFLDDLLCVRSIHGLSGPVAMGHLLEHVGWDKERFVHALEGAFDLFWIDGVPDGNSFKITPSIWSPFRRHLDVVRGDAPPVSEPVAQIRFRAGPTYGAPVLVPRPDRAPQGGDLDALCSVVAGLSVDLPRRLHVSLLQRSLEWASDRLQRSLNLAVSLKWLHCDADEEPEYYIETQWSPYTQRRVLGHVDATVSVTVAKASIEKPRKGGGENESLRVLGMSMRIHDGDVDDSAVGSAVAAARKEFGTLPVTLCLPVLSAVVDHTRVVVAVCVRRAGSAGAEIVVGFENMAFLGSGTAIASWAGAACLTAKSQRLEDLT